MTKSERTRQFIIEQSAEIVNKKGISGTSISDLMEATKLAKGGIYGNFESKEEICLEVYQYLAAKISKILDNAIAGKTSAKQKLFILLDHYEKVAASDAGGCPLLNFGLESDDTNTAIRQSVAKSIKNSQQRIVNVIEEGKKSGEFGKNVDASLFALKMFTMIEGGIFTSRVTRNLASMKTLVNILKKEINTF